MKKMAFVLFCSLLTASAWTHAHEENHHAGHGVSASAQADAREQHAFGRAGDPAQATRRIELVMDDRMRFTPSEIVVSEGEVVELVVTNRGAVMHEIVLGTRNELEQHAQIMRKFPGMEHEEAYMLHVKAGDTGKLVWHFNRAGEFEYGCLIPGHFEAGMIGKVQVRAADASASR